MVCVFASGVFIIMMSSRWISHWKKKRAHMLTESILLPCKHSPFHISCHFVKFFRETLSPYLGSLSYFNLFITVVCTPCGREAFHSCEAEHPLSYWGQAACPLSTIHLIGHVFAASSPFLPLFLIHQSPAARWKDFAWFSMNYVEVPKGKSKHLYLE